MKFRKALIILFCFVLHFSFAQTIGFQRTYGGLGDQQADAAKQTFDGGYIAVGYSRPTPSYNWWIVKTDMYGDTVWTKIFGGDNMVAFDVIQTRDSNYVVCGYHDANGWGQLLKLDQSGDSLWSQIYLGQGWIQAVQEMYNGDLLCGGLSLFKTDANGNTPTPFTALGQIEYLITTHDSGFATVSFTSSDCYLRKFTSAGTLTWSKSLPLQLINASNNDVLEMPDHGYVYVCAKLDYSTVMVRTNSLGDTMWTKKLPTLFYPSGVTRTTDGGFALAVCDHSTGVYDLELAKTDSAGIIQWSHTYGHGVDAYCNSVHQTTDGGYILAGSIDSTQTGDGYDMFLVKTDSLGACIGTSVQEFAGSHFSVSLFPDPMNENATINFSAPLIDARIIISDVQGKMIREFADVSGNEFSFDREGMKAGIYFLNIYAPASSAVTLKFIVTN